MSPAVTSRRLVFPVEVGVENGKVSGSQAKMVLAEG